MKEILKLSKGDLCRIFTDIKPNVFNEQHKLITLIAPNSIVLIVDDRYFHAVYDKPFTLFVIQKARSFEPCKNLEEAERYHSEQGIYVKIAYDDIIGYTNVNNIAILKFAEKQS